MPPIDAAVVDVGWRKASHSVNNGQCVEVAATHADVMVRDSIDPAGPVVSYPARTWQAFLTSAKAGTFDATH